MTRKARQEPGPRHQEAFEATTTLRSFEESTGLVFFFLLVTAFTLHLRQMFDFKGPEILLALDFYQAFQRIEIFSMRKYLLLVLSLGTVIEIKEEICKFE